MNDELDLTNQLRRLAWTLPSEAGGHVEENLLAMFRAHQRRPRRLWIYALAAAVLGCVWFLIGLRIPRPQPVAPPPDRYYDAPGFVALPYAASGVPIESAVVIRVQLRPSELASMGVLMPPEPAGARFKADLLVGQDGVPRAVRFVE